jgi:hypothetical protein
MAEAGFCPAIVKSIAAQAAGAPRLIWPSASEIVGAAFTANVCSGSKWISVPRRPAKIARSTLYNLQRPDDRRLDGILELLDFIWPKQINEVSDGQPLLLRTSDHKAERTILDNRSLLQTPQQELPQSVLA